MSVVMGKQRLSIKSKMFALEVFAGMLWVVSLQLLLVLRGLVGLGLRRGS